MSIIIVFDLVFTHYLKDLSKIIKESLLKQKKYI